MTGLLWVQDDNVPERIGGTLSAVSSFFDGSVLDAVFLPLEDVPCNEIP